MKIAVIGASGHLYYALDGMRDFPDAFICGIAPGCPGENVSEASAQIRSIYPESIVYDNYGDLLEKTKPDITVINSHFHLNGRIAADALSAGAHLFVEKPVCTDLKELPRLSRLAVEKNRQIVAMLGLRYEPWFRAAKNSIKLIGRPLLATAQKSYRLGSRPDFYKSRETFGGLIPWVGSHAIDWIRWLCEAEYLSVRAVHSRQNNRGHGDLETAALCQFEMTDGLLASVNIDYLRPENAPTHDDDRVRIAGSDGVIEVREGRVFLADSEGSREIPQEPGRGIFSDMLYGIQEGRPCGVTTADSLRITEVCLKARKSADTGKTVSLSA